MNGDPFDDDLARKRFMIINMVRFTGVGIAAFGAAITAGVIAMPEMIGYFLIAAGAIDALVAPIVLARAWKTPGP
jgi:hypothetical protein